MLRVEADSTEEAQDIIAEALQTLVEDHAKQRRLSKSPMAVEAVFDIKGRGIVVVTNKPQDLVMIDRIISIEGAGTWRITGVDMQFNNIHNGKPAHVGLFVTRVSGAGEIAVGAQLAIVGSG